VTSKIYCLPDNYEIIDTTLDDIKFYLRPLYPDFKYTNIKRRALDGTEYWPGYVGLNNLKKTDYINVIIQAFSKIETIRDFCLKFDA